jgi:GntR family transcriptional repressor for pyruvate dehydrogenase complex
MTFAALAPSSSAPAACAEAIRRKILSGALAPGARLPPERALAEQLGVNRLTLRAALSQLVAANLLSVRQGSGYLVRAWRREGGPELIAGLAELARSSNEQRVIARDLLAMRRAIAHAVLERLAASVSEAHRLRIATAVETFAARADEELTPDEAAELDLDVLATILEATGSPVFQLCLNPVATVLRSMPALRAAMYADARSNALAYRALTAFLAHPSVDALPLVHAELARRDEATLARLSSGKRRRS